MWRLCPRTLLRAWGDGRQTLSMAEGFFSVTSPLAFLGLRSIHVPFSRKKQKEEQTLPQREKRCLSLPDVRQLKEFVNPFL